MIIFTTKNKFFVNINNKNKGHEEKTEKIYSSTLIVITIEGLWCQ